MEETIRSAYAAFGRGGAGAASVHVRGDFEGLPHNARLYDARWEVGGVLRAASRWRAVSRGLGIVAIVGEDRIPLIDAAVPRLPDAMTEAADRMVGSIHGKADWMAHHRGKALLIAVGWLAVYSPMLCAQDAGAPEWQIAAGGKMAFDVASVKLYTGPFRPPNFPLDPGDAYRPVGGRFSASFPLTTYIAFAYKLWFTPDQRQALLEHLPSWVGTDRFDIQARTEGNPTKDQMRLMVQFLLAERFKLAIHFESHVSPVLAMTLVKPGNTGPKFRPHSEGVPCEATPATNEPPTPGGKVFPPVCDTYMLSMNPNAMAQAGARNTTLALFAGSLPGLGRLDRAVVDQTGLSGRYDFSLEWAPEPNRAAGTNGDAPAEIPGPNFLEAMRQQLGLKLEPAKAPLRVLVIDHIERPSEN
jgi:uncharacterized protein (TIGR03435 family)